MELAIDRKRRRAGMLLTNMLVLLAMVGGVVSVCQNKDYRCEDQYTACPSGYTVGMACAWQTYNTPYEAMNNMNPSYHGPGRCTEQSVSPRLYCMVEGETYEVTQLPPQTTTEILDTRQETKNLDPVSSC